MGDSRKKPVNRTGRPAPGKKPPKRKFRRRNAAATRAQILASAQRLFAAHPYEVLTVRAIAADVGVDAALVIRYFGSKEGLFLAAVKEAEVAEEIFKAEQSGYGKRLAHAAFSDPTIRPDSVALINMLARSASSPEARAIIKKDIEERIYRHIAASIAGPDADVRAALITGLVIGTALMKDLFKFDALRDENAAAAATYFESAAQHLADGE